MLGGFGLVSGFGAAVLAVLVLAGSAACAGSPPGVEPTPAVMAQRADRDALAALAAAAKDRRYIATYTLTVDNRPNRTVTVAIATDGSWIVGVPGGALGGLADVAVFSASAGLFLCSLGPAAGSATVRPDLPPQAPGCARVTRMTAAIDPRVQHIFTDWIDPLVDKATALSVAASSPLPGASGTCYSVESNSAALAPPVDPGVYCYAGDGLLTAARVGFGTLMLAGVVAPAPPSIAMPAPVVAGPPLPIAAPPPPPPRPPSASAGTGGLASRSTLLRTVLLKVGAAMRRPTGMFDRDDEWSALTRFATNSAPGATLGVVSGRRRQGKTFLLDGLCRTAGGLYFAAEEAVEAESLRRLGAVIGEHLGAPAPLQLGDWRQAVDALLGVGRDHEIPVVLDEFPYLAKASPSLPSTIQAAFGPLRDERGRSRTRLLLCGSALSFMGSLLSGTAPLRGRAGLELVVPTLDYRHAARFWGISDPHLALKVNAIVGGTPAYRREFVADDTPTGPEDFDAWVVRTALSPFCPLFREARYLLAEELDIRDTGLYHSVLAAVATGNTSRGGIAGYVGRSAGDLSHHVAVLEDGGLLRRDTDVFRSNRTTYRIAEPLVTFYHAVTRPAWAELERPGSAERVWKRSQKKFATTILGPHFEQVCRDWALRFAGPTEFGDYPGRVGHGTVNDPSGRTSHEVDVVVIGHADSGPSPLLCIGEAKWNLVMDTGHLDRLRHIRELIARTGRFDTTATRLACFSGAGFTTGLRKAASSDVLLVDLARLYG